MRTAVKIAGITENPKYSRRALLKHLGVGAGFLPLISTERSKAVAQTTGSPLRFIGITLTAGVCPPNFFPTGAAGPLPATLPSTLQPLATWASKMIVLRSGSRQTSPIDLKVMVDIGSTYGGHWSYPALLTGAVTGDSATAVAAAPSIDQLFANHLATQGVASSLLNVGARPFKSYTSYRSAGTPNTQVTDPYKLFTNLFSGSNMPATQINTLLARRKSVLDVVGKELTSFGRNLGTEDRNKVQVHLESIQALQAQLQTMPPTTTTTCTAPTITPTGLSFSNNANYPTQVQFMSDIVAAAVICGKARAITMDLIDNGGGNSLTFPWLNIASPHFHDIAHQGSANYAQKSVIDQWFWQGCVSRVVSKLAAAQEGSGTVLDNTVILVSNDMSEGSFHDVRNIPYVIIGSGGGFFKTGRMVTLANNVPNNHLLTSVLHALGMTGVTGVGDPKYAGNIDAALTT
jgi:hypothetical protein